MTTTVAIGEFARLTHLSVKALRHYHDTGLLVPADVDQANGYRRYDPTQVHDAQVIRRLRELDLPLDGIREVMAAPTEVERDRSLVEHLERMEQELARTREVVTSLRNLLQNELRPFDVEIRRLEPVSALITRDRVSATEIEAWSIEAFGGLEAAVGQSRFLRLAGPPTSLFSQDYFSDGIGEVTALVPVEGDNDRDHVEQFAFAQAPHAATVHAGPYGDLDRTYGALGAYVAENLTPTPEAIVEQYLVGPAEAADPTGYRTRIHWPISI